MANIAGEIKPNFAYANGSVWFPTVNQVTGERKLPLYRGGDFGSIMPFVQMEIPGIFESKVIPYENIISFEHSVGDFEAKMTFVDPTPIFAEELFRRVLAGSTSVADPKRLMKVKYGWRIQNPSREFEDFVDQDGLFSTLEYDFVLKFATYQYTDFGVMITLELITQPKHLFGNFYIKETAMEAGRIDGTKESFQKYLTEILNKNVTNTTSPFFVSVLSESIRYDQLISNFQGDSNMTVRDFLNKVAKSLYVPPELKENTARRGAGEVGWWAGEQAIPVTGSDGSRQVRYPIYFYDRDALPNLAANVPIIQYPSNETPVVSWQPSFDASIGYSFLSSNKYKIITRDGNESQTVVDQQAIIAGVPTATNVGGEAERSDADGAQHSTLGESKSPAFIAQIEVGMIGDPSFSTVNTLFTKVAVENSNIIQEGVVRDSSDFFSNFPGLTEDIKRTLPQISDLPGNVSPFNGDYWIQRIIHRIDISQSYRTYLTIFWHNDRFVG